jgi:hypothetical protein
MAVRLSALRASHPLPPGIFLVLISVRGWVDPRAMVRLEELGKLKKIRLIWNVTRDLLACSIVPQPTTLPRAPSWVMLPPKRGYQYKFRNFHNSDCWEYVPLIMLFEIMMLFTLECILFTNKSSFSHIMVDESCKNTKKNTRLKEHPVSDQNSAHKTVSENCVQIWKQYIRINLNN